MATETPGERRGVTEAELAERERALKWLRYGLEGNPPGYSPHWDAIRALLREREELTRLARGWRCFHCGVWITKEAEAAGHFGTRENEQPAACLTKLAEAQRENVEAVRLLKLAMQSRDERVAELEAQLADEQEQHRLGVLSAEAQLQAEREAHDAMAKLVETVSKQRDTAERGLAAETEARKALEQHEAETHATLGAILGTDDSLAECAKRAVEARKRAEAERDEALRVIKCNSLMTELKKANSFAFHVEKRAEAAEEKLGRLRVKVSSYIQNVSDLAGGTRVGMGWVRGMLESLLAEAEPADQKGEGRDA